MRISLVSTISRRSVFSSQIEDAKSYHGQARQGSSVPRSLDTLAVALSGADLAVGRLAGEASRFPDSHLFVRREAVLSSRIEGTRTTLAELLAAEAGTKIATDNADLHEVANHVAALEYGLDRLDRLPLSLRSIRQVHDLATRRFAGRQTTV
ncbi:MAG: hypothetical protein OXC54_01835, partial [Rhodospirillaceae bacterium]|nr:hypothetical protein [Rhodospirillaceae bacterium]